MILYMEKAEQLMDGYEQSASPAKIFETIKKSNCSAYDCEFVALAQELDIPLLTYDKQIIREFPSTALKPEDYLASQ